MFPVLHPYQITRYSNAHQGMALSSGVLHPYQITRYSNPKLELKSTLCLFYYIHILLFASPLFSICCLLTEKSSKASDMPLGTPSGMLSEPIKIFITESQTWENDCYDQPLTGMLPDTAYFCSRQAAFLHCQIVFKSTTRLLRPAGDSSIRQICLYLSISLLIRRFPVFFFLPISDRRNV